MGVNSRQLFTPGPLCLTVNKQIMHYAIPAFAEDGQKQRFARVNCLYPAEATVARMSHGNSCHLDQCVLKSLDEYLRENNQIIQLYKSLREFAEDEEKRTGERVNDVVMYFVVDPCRNSSDIRGERAKRVFSLPTGEEIAYITSHNDGELGGRRDIMVYPRNAKPARIDMFSSMCDPFAYVLLHPDGFDRGWSRSMRNEGISLMKFYSHRLSVRKNSFNQLLRFGNLTGQYIIDSYMMIEGERLEYLINNQTRIRAETYAGVHDFLQTHASD